MFRISVIIIAALLMCIWVSPVFAEEQVNLDDRGRALHGYDPVSYFTGKPAKGNDEFSLEYQGAKYFFANQSNLEKFKNNPESYQFGYGGFCAWAMLEGQRVDVDPKRYKNINGVVYLFYNRFFVDTLDKWNELAAQESEAVLLSRADAQWLKISSM